MLHLLVRVHPTGLKVNLAYSKTPEMSWRMKIRYSTTPFYFTDPLLPWSLHGCCCRCSHHFQMRLCKKGMPIALCIPSGPTEVGEKCPALVSTSLFPQGDGLSSMAALRLAGWWDRACPGQP